MGIGTWQWRTRTGAALVLVLCVGGLVQSALAGPAVAAGTVVAATPDPAPVGDESSRPADSAESTDTARRSLTVVTTQGFYTGLRPGARDGAELVAFDASGTVVYHNTTYDVYFDVDAVTGTRATVEYVAAERLGGADCDIDPCSLNLVERVNLSTGAVTRVYDAVTPQYDTGRWHDVDRLNETHLVVADIVYDRVFIVDVRSDHITWQWNASEHYPPEAGGGSGDWTHINDIEVLDDGRLMASLRNMDEVLFIDIRTGVVEEWTLGADDDHGILYEQHNPDFIPAERGGPAVIVADSENGRVVEYRRVGDRWSVAWAWRDQELQWPRDADRLPNGHTLIADAHGDRVVEIDTAGEVVWQVDIGRPYDVERPGTGDESAGGFAAGSNPEGRGTDNSTLGAPPATIQGAIGDGGAITALKDILPGPLVNGLLFVAPPWFGFRDLLLVAVLAVDLLGWLGVEWYWSRWTLSGPIRRLQAWFG